VEANLCGLITSLEKELQEKDHEMDNMKVILHKQMEEMERRMEETNSQYKEVETNLHEQIEE
jgi:hypothetical protein